MEIGLKIWRVEARLDELIERAKTDFIETMAIIGEDYTHLKDIGIPITIHNTHSRFDVNPADPSLVKKNIDAINHSIKLADMLNASSIVVHPGFYDNPNCNLQTSIDLLKTFGDPRLIIENVPFYIKKDSLKYNFGKGFDEISQIIKETNMGLCMDFGHATAAAYGLKINHMELIKQLMKFKPDYFHFYDSVIKSPTEEHLHFGDGNLNIIELKEMLPKKARVVLETPVDVEGRIKDVAWMRE